MGTDTAFELKPYLNRRRGLVEDALHTLFPKSDGLAAPVVDAMTYSLFAGGKRLRPILCMAGAEAVGAPGETVLPMACALELIHTYSLIHDDLPVMDDDDLRRGKPTNHKVFGEAVALLAGDALLTQAFHLMTVTELVERVPPRALLKAIHLVAQAAGHEGMVGGQVVDIQWEGKPADFSTVQFIHNHKTAALIRASVASGVVLSGGNGPQLRVMMEYGQKIGLAFQISDDILDIEGETEIIGKRAGADTRKGKLTYPSVVGLARSKEIQSELVSEAIQCLKGFDQKADPLRSIAQYIIERKK
jgi:geranylgeranyl diphosphate synthase type II